MFAAPPPDSGPASLLHLRVHPPLTPTPPHPCLQVNQMWSGLGYYRRAKYLLDGARHVRDKLGGQFPTTAKGLLQIPGGWGGRGWGRGRGKGGGAGGLQLPGKRPPGPGPRQPSRVLCRAACRRRCLHCRRHRLDRV
jgi:hypothetical protein